jgi:delta24-sterol reductase
MDAHRQAVAKISGAVRQFFGRGEPYRIFHGSTNSTRPRGRDTARMVDISALRNVLQVDARAKTVLVEPNVPMDRLVAATLKHRLVPPVVMEFPGITAGGGYAGTAGESSSFKHGFFDKTVNSVEMVLADGEVVQASRDANADLFHGAAGAVGTLGITTLLELQLVEARKYVKATYHRLHSVNDTIRFIQRQAEDPGNDYVDGILFSQTHGVVITGVMTDEEPPTAQTFSYPGDPWFYLHVQDKTRDGAASRTWTESIPLAEYLFRYDRGGFWVGRSAFRYFGFPFARAMRWLLDDFMHTRMLYRALHATARQSRTYVVQDLALPYATAGAFVDYAARAFGIWPLWLCPLLETPPPTFHPHVSPPGSADEKGHGGSSSSSSSSSSRTTGPPSRPRPRPMLNIGLWGQGPPDERRCLALNRDLERRLRDEFGGMKWLYAHAYYAEDEFWAIYDRGAYRALRETYRATSLPSVYDKVRVDVGGSVPAAAPDGVPLSWTEALLRRWPFEGFWGIRKAIQSREYLPRTPPWRAKP